MKFEYTPEKIPTVREAPSEDAENAIFSHRDLFEQAMPFAEKFNAFLDEVQKADAAAEEVDGKMREYMTLSNMYAAYQKAFGSDGLRNSSIIYRLKNIDMNKFPEDIMVVEDAGVYEAKYHINRLNKNLLQELFLPSPLADEEFENVKEEVLGLDDDFDAADHLEDFRIKQ